MDWPTPSKAADFGDSTSSNSQSKWFANIPGKSPLRKVVVHSTDERVDSKIPLYPMPPATPKRSQTNLTSTHKLASTADVGVSDRGNLINTVNAMVSQGLKNISVHEYDHDIKLLRLQVYRDAFQHLINEFNIYKPFLSAVKNEYDTLIDDFGDDLRSVADLKVELRMKEQDFNAKMKAKDASFRSELVARSSQILNLEKEIRKKDDEIAAVKAHFEQIDQKNMKLEKEVNDLRKSCEVLTNSLTRSEEEKRIYQSNDSGRQRELQASKMAVQKANEELERIRNMLNDAESVQATLVGPEVVMKHVDTIRSLKASLAAKDAVHKRLIDRYSTLKSAVDMAFEEAGKESDIFGEDAKFPSAPKLPPTLSTEEAGPVVEMSSPIKKWAKLKGAVAIQALLKERKMSSFEAASPAKKVEARGNTDLITSGMEQEEAPPTAEELEMQKEIEELGDLIVKSDKAGGSRKIIEVLVTEVLRLKRKIQDLTAELEQDDDEYDEFGQVISPDGATAAAAGGNTLGDGKIDSGWAHFEGLGLDETIPKYLRISGKIQNLFMTKRDTEQYVNEIWAAKEEYETQLNRGVDDGTISDETAAPFSGAAHIHLSAFFEIFLEQRFKTQTRAVEFAYNFIDSLTKYSFDSDCKLFVMIMQGDLSEEIRHDQLNMLDDVLNELRHEDQMIHHKIEGRLPLDVFFRVIRRAFPTKGEHSIRRLEKALELEIKGRRLVLYEELLEEDEEGNQGKFCETLRMQHLTECSTFSRRVMDVITQFYDDTVAEATTTNSTEELALMTSNGPSLSVNQLRTALSLADADKPRNEINKYLARGCNKSIQDVLLMETDRTLMVPVASFKTNLKRGLIKKSKPTHETMMKNRAGNMSSVGDAK